MSSLIIVFVDKDDRNVFVAKVERDVITKHSKAVKALLDADSTKTDIVIKNAPLST